MTQTQHLESPETDTAPYLESLAKALRARDIPCEIETRALPWTSQPRPTLTAGECLGEVEVTADRRGVYRWLDRHGHVRLARPGNAEAVAQRIITDREGTQERPEPPPGVRPRLPRRSDRPHRPLYQP